MVDYLVSLVVWPGAIHVRNTVYEKCNVKRDAESKIEIHPKRCP